VKTMNRKLIPLVLLAAIASACGKPDSEAEGANAPVPVVLSAQDVAIAEARTIGSAVLVSGNLDPADVVSVKAQIPGTVTRVSVDRGSRVSRGQVLAVIEAQGIRGQQPVQRHRSPPRVRSSRLRSSASRHRRNCSTPERYRRSSTAQRRRMSKLRKLRLRPHRLAQRARMKVQDARRSPRPSQGS